MFSAKVLITAIKYILIALLSIVNAVLYPFYGNFTWGQKSKEDDIKLDLALLSDVHMWHNDGFRKFRLRLGLYDIEKNDHIDALVLVGDNTDRCNVENYENLLGVMREFSLPENIIMVNGNHDTWDTDGEDTTAMFIEYNKKITGRDLTKLYYSTSLNGYPVICMAGEEDRTSAYISEEQLLWLDAEMAKASLTGLPIFVFCHWPLRGTHNEDDENIGEQSDRVYAILKKYKNVFYVTGHIHNNFSTEETKDKKGYSSIERDGSLTLINLPSFMFGNMTKFMESGTGCHIEVYQDRVVIRPRNFVAGIWYCKYETTIYFQ